MSVISLFRCAAWTFLAICLAGLSGESFTFDERQAALLDKVNGIYRDQTGRDRECAA